MISEGSCDTEDWSNNTENSALITGINYILKYIHIEKFKLYHNMFRNIIVFTEFDDKINAALVSAQNLDRIIANVWPVVHLVFMQSLLNVSSVFL